MSLESRRGHGGGGGLSANLFWPLAVFAILALGAVAAAGFGSGLGFDEAARQREQSVVQNGIAGREREVAHMAVTESTWDAAVRNLDNQFDLAWARDNIGAYFNQNDGFEESFVLDKNDQPIFAADHAKSVEPGPLFARFAGDVQRLVRQVRGAEARRGPLKPPVSAGVLLSDGIQASTVANIREALYILTATLVQPDFGTAMPLGPKSPIVVTAMRIDQGFLDQFADRFLLRNVHIETRDPRHVASQAYVTLRNERGDYVATLDWTPDVPGNELLKQLGLPVLAVLGSLALAILGLYRRERRVAEVLCTSEARATHLAYHDALTGLPNRLLFFDRLGQVLHQLQRSGETIAIHCIDLDRFKDINDTFGHHAGDELIRLAGTRMAAQCRTPDTFARLSGDEFAIIQMRATPSAAASLAARLTEVMRQPIDLQAGRVFIGCSVGVSLISDGRIDPDEALRQADVALYRAKETAKGQFCFFKLEMDAAIKARRALESDLRHALAHGELQMEYQPQVNARDGMTGVEALARWHHEVRGDVAPSVFVRIAEECGLIVELGRFTLRRAFEDSKRWPRLKVAINVSARQLRMQDFASNVIDMAAECGVDPRRFELEINEAILLGDDPETREMLYRLHRAGFALVLDDFGTGYSSLSYLQHYPISKIKIDRSFIANLGAEAEGEAMIGAFVKLAGALHMSVIAEGVETAEQVARLAATDCVDMQGYLFGRPVSADEIDILCAGRKPGGAAMAGGERSQPADQHDVFLMAR
jgi:diguanylate cyclase (GGDEF)-like protein